MENSTLISDTYSLIAKSAERAPESIALETFGHHSLSFRGLLRHVHYINNCLQALSIERSDRVAIVLPGGIEMAVVLAGVSASAVCAPLNPGFQLKEFAACFDTMNIKLLIVASGHESHARQVADKNNILILELIQHNSGSSGMLFSFEGHPDQETDDAWKHSFILPEDLAIVLHTSGTTSQPKIVPLTHLNICTAVRYVCDALSLGPYDRCLCMMPQFHIGGFVDLLLAPLASGGRVICAPGINPELFFELLTKCRPTWYQAVPATLALILAHAKALDIKQVESSLRFIRSVAAPLPSQMLHDLEALFQVPVIETFGMTEAAPLITTNPLPPEARKPGSVGRSVGPDVAIMDDAGTLLHRGEKGEIVIKGLNVMSGYENNHLANDQSFAQGWFRTGDIGFLDDEDYLFITGRLKEMINRGGEKISPNEIDTVLLEYPDIEEVMVFAIPHAILGEDIAVAIVMKSGHTTS
ncbi:MAG: AMP-dependent synthetase, partial [Deltaproteobacteria bacterium]